MLGSEHPHGSSRRVEFGSEQLVDPMKLNKLDNPSISIVERMDKLSAIHARARNEKKVRHRINSTPRAKSASLHHS
jgi:hypothetical protein